MEIVNDNENNFINGRSNSTSSHYSVTETRNSDNNNDEPIIETIEITSPMNLTTNLSTGSNFEDIIEDFANVRTANENVICNNANNNFIHYLDGSGKISTISQNLCANSSENIPKILLSNEKKNFNKTDSTAKLLPSFADDEDEFSNETKCSLFRGLVLCLCLNVSFTNIIRFTRELDKYGSGFLISYFLILILIGFPIVLLEIAMGQFLGQGSVHTWKLSPICKGASITGRFASWLSSIWISMQAVISLVYIGMLSFKSIPFTECSGGVKILQTGYKENEKSGQECILKSILISVWEDVFYFLCLVFSLMFLWIIVVGCTSSAKIYRRTIFLFGLLGFILLVCLTGWEVHISLIQQYFPSIWPFKEVEIFLNSSIWFSALSQVIYSTGIGLGIIPVVTGKFLYKTDAAKTTIMYCCFNLLVNALSIILFMTQYDNPITRNATVLPLIEEIKPLTVIYDSILSAEKNNQEITKLIGSLIYGLGIISSVITISSIIFSSAKMLPKNPNYVLCLIAVFLAVALFIMPKFQIPSILDSRIIPTIIISSMVFEMIATMWIYGAKNIYIDLEFSIGRSISKFWLVLWTFSPVILTGILLWWCVDIDDSRRYDLLNSYFPRWAPIVIVLVVLFICGCIEISKQVDYNFFGMICEAAKPSKEWGPSDPLARHAWKQWRSACQNTGRKDFTLRRRGTKDYTHSIKLREQYLNTKSRGIDDEGNSNTKELTASDGSSAIYGGSFFGDSAIEEDMSFNKYMDVNLQYPFYGGHQQQHCGTAKIDKHPLKLTQRVSSEFLSNNDNQQSTISNECNEKQQIIIKRNFNKDNLSDHHIIRQERCDKTSSFHTPCVRNSLVRHIWQQNGYFSSDFPKNSPQFPCANENNSEQLCWRKSSSNSEEYSTEL